MSILTSEVRSGTLYLIPEGRIDSSNAGVAEAEVQSALNAAHEAVIIDLDKLEYISSAGLRVILRLRKNEPSLKMVNASAEVYEIFDMTGFTEMMPIEKAYRRLSVEGCEVIGQGANGKVYRLDPDTIIKVYLNPDCLPDIHRERELARKAFILGIPTAIPYDVVRVGEGYGSVFELLNAQSMAKLIAKDPETLDEYIPMYVDLMKKIHSTELKPGEMPDMKSVALGWAAFMKDYLPADKAEKLYSLVKAVPDSNHMMHGDYHVKNVMLQNGEVLLIDMDTLCMGHPIFELASMFIAYQGFSINDHEIVKKFLGIPYEITTQIWQKSLRLYLNTEDDSRVQEVADKAMIIGFTRIMRRSIRRGGFDTEEGRRDIESCRSEICRLLDKVDTLEF